jgi:hypothetical protein
LGYTDRGGMKAKSVLGDVIDSIDWRNAQNNVGSSLQTAGLTVA